MFIIKKEQVYLWKLVSAIGYKKRDNCDFCKDSLAYK